MQPYVRYVESSHSLEFTEHTVNLKRDVKLQLTLEDDNSSEQMKQSYDLYIICAYCVKMRIKR